MYSKLVYYTLLGLILFSLFFLSQARVLAQDYVLPYPGFMPGHSLYEISEVVDKLQEWWSFGNLAKFKHHLAVSDKKLIEAKTLAEYKQYLLAVKAIGSYEHHLLYANKSLSDAQNESKDISQKRTVFKSAISKHREVFERLKSEHPKEVFWNPEKGESKTIEMEKIINRAIELGKECGG